MRVGGEGRKGWSLLAIAMIARTVRSVCVCGGGRACLYSAPGSELGLGREKEEEEKSLKMSRRRDEQKIK